MAEQLDGLQKGTPYGRKFLKSAWRGFFLPANNLMGSAGRVGAVVLEVEESPENQTENNQDEVERGILIHLFSLLSCEDRINTNTDDEEYQGQNDACRQSYPGERLLGEHSKHENCQTELCGVVEELRQVIPSVLAHGPYCNLARGLCQ